VTARPLALSLAAAVTAVLLPAQTLKNERHLHAWTWSMEHELLQLCLHLPEQRRTKIAGLLANSNGSDPLQDLGRALAMATTSKPDAKPDEKLMFRRGLMLLARPEVVDPVGAPDDGRVPQIDTVTLTVWAPRTLTMPGTVRFALRIQDTGGKTVWQGEIRKDTGHYELRTFQTHRNIPAKDLPDGLYWAEADTILEGEEPETLGPPMRVPFWLLRGFVKRRLHLAEELRRLQPELEPLPWALLSGADRVVHRFFSGESGANSADCLRELKIAERVLQNICNEEKRAAEKSEANKPRISPLHGLSGWVALEFPNQDMWQVEVALRLMPDRQENGPLPPLVLFLPGAPAWSPRGRRPRSPESLSPGFLVEMLKTSGFDKERRWQLVVVESPGRVRNTLQTLGNVMAALEALNTPQDGVRFDRRKIVLVGDRQGASGVVSLAMEHPDVYRGLVISNGGVEALTLNNIDKLGGLPMLVIPGHGHVASEGLLQHYEIARKDAKADHIQVLSKRCWPWPIALPLASREIEAFIARVLAPATRPPTSSPTSRSAR